MLPYLSPLPDLLRELDVEPSHGLSSSEASSRLAKYGPNRISKSASVAPWRLLLRQFADLLSVILLCAAGIALYLGQSRDTIILSTIVVVNALVGFYQEFKAEKVLEKLKNLIVPQSRTLRDGIEVQIASDGLVPGDIVVLTEGDGIPADLRLISSTGFSTNDFILTGESDPQPKSEKLVLDHEVEVTDRNNCVYMGTTVARGEARGIVFATGMQTEIGQIAHHSETVATTVSPLQRQVNDLARRITKMTIVMATALMAVRLGFQDSPQEALIFAIGIAASMVPQGLPAQISVALSLGVGRMARQNALVKQLSAVEALGASSVIASDKTGTITKNEMTITHCSFDGAEFSISGTGYDPAGEISDASGRILTASTMGDLKVFFLDGYLSSTGRVNPPDAEHGGWYALGDPTEAAFATLALKSGYDLSELDRDYPRLSLFPFDSDRKRMSIIREHKGKRIAFAKGGIESILSICTHDIVDGKVTELTADERTKLLRLAAAYSSEALRVIAVAYKDMPITSLRGGSEAIPSSQSVADSQGVASPSEVPQGRNDMQAVESDMVFAGFVTMVDPPHDEVREAVQRAFDANIKLVMITGDNAVTARAVAGKIGMVLEHGEAPEVVDGDVLKSMHDEAVMDLFHHRAVIFSRVSPSDKLRIVTLLQSLGETVAVTGDGVNDTLSLKKADIGVAMGRMGSEVAKEAADMVLLDDNFSSIVLAVGEGRTIYRNLEKTVVSTLTSNFGELTCVLLGFVGAFFGLPVPILAVQILAVDLVGEMLPLTFLTLDPPEKSLMTATPRDPRKPLVTWAMIRSIAFFGLLMGSVGFASFYFVLHSPYLAGADEVLHHQRAMTAAYIGIMLCQFMNILSRRTERSVFTSYLWSNRALVLSYLISIGLILTIVYAPFVHYFLYTAPLALSDWTYPIMGALAFLCVHEGRKAWGK